MKISRHLLALAFLLGLLRTGALAITVSNLNDSGAGSLRQAFATAVANPGADTITFAPGVFTVASHTVTLLSEIVVSDTAGVTVDATAIDPAATVPPSAVTVSGGSAKRLFSVAAGGKLTLRGVTLTGGRGVGATLTGSGGAVYNAGTATLESCTLSSNSVVTLGGAIRNNGTLVLTQCTFAGNQSSDSGGAIANTGTLPLTLTHCTIAGNTATNSGGGIFLLSGMTTLTNCIVSGNAATNGRDLWASGPAGGITRAGANIIGFFGKTPDAPDNGPVAITANPLLGALTNNGGPTDTMALLAYSQAIDAVPAAAISASLVLDQRGFARSLGGGPDLGAYESGDANFTGSGLTLYARVPTGMIGTGVFFEIADNVGFSVPSKISTLVGSAGVFGDADGLRSAATLGYPSGVAQDSLGNIFIADTGNNVIRMMDVDGFVSTIAGNGIYGLANGPGLSAEFAFPSAIAVGADDNVYVADTYNHRIAKLTRPPGAGQEWTVANLAGTGTAGFLNGAGAVAKFSYPYGVDLDAAGNVYVADALNNRIRKVTPAGAVSTFAGTGATSVTLTNCATNGTTTVTCASTAALTAGSSISGTNIAAGTTVASITNGTTFVLSAAATGSASGLTLTARSEAISVPALLANYDFPYGVAFDSHGNLFVADGDHQRIRKIDQATGLVSTFAGSGVAGLVLTNCTTNTAGLGTTVICASTTGLLPGVSVKGTNIATGTTVASVTNATQFVLSQAATGSGSSLTLTAAGIVDGTGTAARFYTPAGLAFDGDDNLFVSDQDNHAIRKITPAGVVSTSAGRGIAGFADGGLAVAKFNAPAGLLVARDGTVIVADTENHLLRTVAVGPLRVPAIANPADINPVGEQLSAVLDLSLLGLTPGTQYFFRYRLPTGSTFATGQSFTQVELPVVVTAAADKLTPTAGRLNGTVNPKTLPTTAVLEYSTDPTLLAPYLVTTRAGTGAAGFLDSATSSLAQFHSPEGLAVSGGNVYVADFLNHRIRKIDASGAVTTFAGSGVAGLDPSVVQAAVAGAAARFDHPAGIAAEPDVVLLNCATTFGSTNVTCASTAALAVGASVSGTNIAPGTTVVSKPNATTFTISVAATGTSNALTLTAGGAAFYVADEFNHCIRKIAANGQVTTLAGSGVAGFADGAPGAAQFLFPTGVALDSASPPNVYVADSGNHCIRKVTSTGVVSTFAGAGVSGFADGVAATSQFASPQGVAVNAAGDVLVADTGNHLIRVISGGSVATFAGSTQGFLDGPGASAMFSSPTDIALAADGVAYVTDSGNHRVRRITVGAEVTTYAGSGVAGAVNSPANGLYPVSATQFNQPGGIAVDAAGGVLVTQEGLVRKIARGALPTVVAQALVTNNSVQSIAGDVSGLLPGATYYFRAKGTCLQATVTGSILSFTTPTAPITVNAGPTIAAAEVLNGQATAVDFGETPLGTLVARKFIISNPNGTSLTVTAINVPAGYQLTAGIGVNVIAPGGTLIFEVTLLANATGGTKSGNIVINSDAPGLGAFVFPITGIALAPPAVVTLAATANSAGNATLNGTVNPLGSATDMWFQWSLTGQFDGVMVSALAGSSAGDVDGAFSVMPLTNCVTNGTTTVTCASTAGLATGLNISGANIDAGTKIASITNGTTFVLTAAATASGTGLTLTASTSVAKFNRPSGLAADAQGNIFVADTQNHRIRKVTFTTDGSGNVTGSVASFAGTGAAGFADGAGATAQFNEPTGVAFGSNGILYVCDSLNHRIRAITPAGVVSTYAGVLGEVGFTDGVSSAARFNTPWGLAVDAAGVIYVTDRENHRIRKVAIDGAVSTLAGMGITGTANGAGNDAQFNKPQGIAVDAAGSVYVTEATNHAIRKVAADGFTSIFAGALSSGLANGTAANSRFFNPVGLAVDGGGAIFVADKGNHSIRKITSTIGLGGAVSVNVVTFAGLGTAGTVDGLKSVAQFDGPISVLATPDRGAIVGELTNSTLRKIVPTEPLLAAATGLTGTAVIPVSLQVTGLKIGTTYSYRAVATNARGTNFGNAFNILAGTPFEQWQLAHFGANANDPLIGDQGATPANDGISNRLKYALGLDPFTNSAGSLPDVEVNGGDLTLTYNKVLTATDLLYTVEWTSDLVTWQTAGITQQVSPPNGATQQIVASIPIAPERVKFLRLTVTFLAP